MVITSTFLTYIFLNLVAATLCVANSLYPDLFD